MEIITICPYCGQINSIIIRPVEGVAIYHTYCFDGCAEAFDVAVSNGNAEAVPLSDH